MSHEIGDHYDVIIMGGGPGGSTLGSQLARTTDLSVAIFDKAKFPREHIGESLAHPATTALEEIGALEKVMNADFTIQKFGGIFYWDGKEPSAGFFDEPSFKEDGAHRFAYHVNRAELDEMLLRHAEELGVNVFEETSVTAFRRLDDDGCEVTLGDGRKVHGTYFVDASGRRNSITAKQKRAYLSGYKNIAIWQHFTGCQHGYSIDEKWNIFRDGERSPIVCSAFEDGWCWFIPVPKIIDGERVVTHSIGIVTIPEVLKESGKDFTDPAVFRAAIETVPLVRDLIGQNAHTVGDKVSTATNYSMINDEFNNFDEKWILVGDAAYFVDPLFSSGVAFAMHHGLSAALLIKTAAEGTVPEDKQRDMWRDYDHEWHGIAESFSLSIDQWYHAIGENHSDSVYWHSRGTTADLGVREETFQILISTAMHPDLLRLMTKDTYQDDDLNPEGPYMKALDLANPGDPDDTDLIGRAEGAKIRESLGLDLPGFKGGAPVSPDTPRELRDAVAQYWRDPVRNGDRVESPTAVPTPCHRFVGPTGTEVRSIAEQDNGIGVWEALADGPCTYRDLRDRLSEAQLVLLKLLIRAGVLAVDSGRPVAPVA